MKIITSNSILINSSSSDFSFNQNSHIYNIGLDVGTVITSAFDRIKSVRLFLKSTTDYQSYISFFIQLSYDSRYDRYYDQSVKETINGDPYVVFDLTDAFTNYLNPIFSIYKDDNGGTVTLSPSESYLEIIYEEPYDYLDKQELFSSSIGSSYSYNIDILTNNLYLSRTLFSDALNFELNLVYDFVNPISDEYSIFPLGYKLNVLDKLSFSQNNETITLSDSSFNKRVFTQTNEQNIYVDSSKTGLILEKITTSGAITYKLFSPLNNAHKIFNSNGKIKKIVLENNDEINFTYASDSITITDYRGVIVSITKSSASLTTITSNKISQTYSLNFDNNNLLASLTFYKLSSSSLLSTDSFSYNSETNRLISLSSFDNYGLDITRNTKILTIEETFNDNIYKNYKFEYFGTYSICKNLLNLYSDIYYFDDDRNVIVRGRDNDTLNDQDLISFIENEGLSNYLFNLYEVEEAYQFTFGNNNSPSIIIEGYSNNSYATVYTNSIQITDGFYYLIFKAKPITRNVSSRNHIDKSLFVLADSNPIGPTYIYPINGIVFCHSFTNEYVIGNFISHQGLSSIQLTFALKQFASEYEISNVYLIKRGKKRQSTHYKISNSLDFNSHSDIENFIELTSAVYNIDNNHYPLSRRDLYLNTVLNYKTSFTKYFFYNDLKSLHVYSSPTSTHLSLNLSSSYLWGNIKFAYREELGSGRYVLEAIASSSNNQKYKKCLYKEIDSSHYYFSNEEHDYHNNILTSTDFRGVVTTNTYSNNLLTETRATYDNEYISKIYSYDSYNRNTGDTSLIGDNVSQTSLTYKNNYLNIVKDSTDGNNVTTNYTYSTRYEYQKEKSIALTLLNNASIGVTLSDIYSLSNVNSPMGEFRFTYDSYRNRLASVSFFHPISLLKGDEEQTNDRAQPISPGVTTNLLTVSHIYDIDASYSDVITYANNYTYRKDFDSYSRLTKIYDYSSDLYIEYVYDIEAPQGKVTTIYDDSGHVDDEINISYLKENISQLTSNDLEINYSYDDFNLLTSKEVLFNIPTSVNDIPRLVYTYTSDSIDDSLTSISVDIYKNPSYVTSPFKIVTSSVSKDAFGRLTSSIVSIENYPLGFSNISYANVNNRSSLEIKSVTYALGSRVTNFLYDNNGNITDVTSSSVEDFEYQYDSLNRLTQETNNIENYYIDYTYSSDGNILSAVKRDLSDDSIIESHTYSYDTNLPFKLTSYNGVTITYDNFLNPLTLNGMTLSYYRGNKLHTVTKNNNTVTYEYNGTGLRVYKEFSDKTIEYYYEGDRLLKEIRTYSNNQVDHIVYLYGIDGIIGFTLNGLVYLYEKDVFGNVLAIYSRTTRGDRMPAFMARARYKYDAYGNHKVYNSVGNIDTDPTSIGNINPIRYRSYYYDTETGFYYCKSRYYVPYLRRWLTMDSISYIDKEKIQGSNLFAYCLNNPVMYKDERGQYAFAFLLGFVIGLALMASIVLTIEDVKALQSKSVIAEITKDGIQIKNSYLIRTPWVRLWFLFDIKYNSNSSFVKGGNEENSTLRFKGSTFGAEFEWFLHNTIYLFDNSKDYQNADLGNTIFNDEHGWKSAVMSIAYAFTHEPLLILIDLLIYLFWS